MNVTEFSNNFDVLYNNIMSNAAPGINEYEKSVFLTKAQDEILKNYFNQKGNKYQQGFDGSAKRQIDFSGLISVKDATLLTSGIGSTFDIRAMRYKLPDNVFLIINESIVTQEGVKQVVPISFEDYTRLMSKPYKEPLKYQAWRLVTNGNNQTDITVELIPHSNDVIHRYIIRYVRRPRPIILTDLSSDYGDITINGEKNVSECELNPLVHEEILQRAVENAKISYTGDINGVLQAGQRSE